jgi:hypothetical protein
MFSGYGQISLNIVYIYSNIVYIYSHKSKISFKINVSYKKKMFSGLCQISLQKNVLVKYP